MNRIATAELNDAGARIRIATLLATLALLALAPRFALAQSNVSFESEADDEMVRYRDGRFLELDGGVTIQRADEAESDEVVRNMPLLPGDRVWTDARGRAEILFADGEVFRLSDRAKVDYLGRDRDADERLAFRVFSGSFHARLYGHSYRRGGFELRVPGGWVRTTAETSFRVDVRMGETTISVYEGAVLGELRGQRISMREGERVIYNADEGVLGPRAFQRNASDDFSRWCDDRDREFSRARERNAYLPDDLQGYSQELGENGDWLYEPPLQTYVYVPRVDPYWSPYTYGRWVYTLYGWTWVPNERWGFVTSHYGRWGHSTRVGWYWIPRSGFRGAWVSWTSSSWDRYRYVGWCATGWNGRPVVLPGTPRGRAVERGRSRDPRWSYVRAEDLGHREVGRRIVDRPGDGSGATPAVWSGRETPDREGRAVVRGEGRAAATRRGRGEGGTLIHVAPSPGDSLPELRADPITTIPSPELRRRRGGDDRTGYGALDDDRDAANPIAVEAERWNSAGGRARSSRPSGTTPRRGSAENETTAAPRDPGSSTTPDPSPAANAGDDSSARPRARRETGERSSAPAQNDSLLRRFFRSIQDDRSGRGSGERDRSTDDATTRRPRPNRDSDDSSARSNPEPRRASPPSSNDGGRPSRPSNPGAERSRPERSSSPAEARPRGGDDRAAPRPRKPDGI